MTPLRQRLIEELVLRGYSDKTKEAYVHAVAGLATHYRRAPDQLKDEETRAYLLQLHTQAGLPLFVLKRLLGHTSLSTTSNYLHVSREHLAKIKSPLDVLHQDR